MAEVQLTKVTKKLGDFVAVNTINLEIEDGRFTVLVGPSGCEKTTTLRMIAGLEETTEGEIRIGDRVVNRMPLLKDRDIAMVFQNYALCPHTDVYSNMAFGLKLRKAPKTEIRKGVKEATVLLGIEDKLKSKPRELSGGQRQQSLAKRSCENRRCSCSTSHSPTWTPSCASRPGPNSSNCIGAWALPPSMLRTIRPKP